MKQLQTLIYLIPLFCLSQIYGQILGGNNHLQIANLPTSAQIAAAGGLNNSLPDPNPTLAFQNPAVLSDTMNQWFSFSINPYYASITNTNISYVFKTQKTGIWQAGVSYINYGKMTRTDDIGNIIGEFKPQDFILTVNKSFEYGPYQFGAGIKYIGSEIIPSYTSYALLFDAGVFTKHPNKDLYFGAVVKNIGFALKKYDKNEKFSPPYDIQISSTYKLPHVPFRFSLTAHHLYRWDITYLDTINYKIYDINNEVVAQKKSFADMLMRHLNWGVDLVFSPKFQARFSYNYIRRKELRSVDYRIGLTGFSWGLSYHLSKLRIEFSRSIYHVVGGKNFIALHYNMNQVFKKKSKTTNENN